MLNKFVTAKLIRRSSWLLALLLVLGLNVTPAAYAFPAEEPPACSVVGWGVDWYGQITPPAGLSDVVAISAGGEYLSGGHSLALKSDGTVVGWGYDFFGQATPPAGLGDVVAISAGAYHNLALKADGTVIGWGRNDAGQATPPAGLSNVVAISAGYAHSLALKSDGTVVAWGDNSNGQAAPPAGLGNVVAIAAGYVHSLALKSDGTVVGWGDSFGYGAETPPAGLSNVVAISAGEVHSLALKSDGTVVGWGYNDDGRATPPAGLGDVVAIAVGNAHNLALKSDGTVVAWGNDDFGQATPPTGLSDVTAIAAGGVHSLAVQCAPVGNNPPTVAADNASLTVGANQAAVNTGTMSDPDGDVAYVDASIGVLDFDLPNGTWIWIYGTSGLVQNLVVTITAFDANGNTAETTFTLNPTGSNTPPTANAGPDQTVYRNDVVTVTGAWTDPEGAADNPYTWSWDLDGDTIPDDSGTANYGDTVVRTTSFAVDGAATLTFSVTDSAGESSSDTVVITVVNRAPAANDQSLSTDEDTDLPITLTGSDADNDALSFSIESVPANGALNGTAPNLTYTPNPDFFGSDSFTFKVNDGLADSNIATVNITVNSVNDPAVAVDDSAITDEDTPVTIDVQANDSAGPANEDAGLTTTAVTAPANGSADINGDGSITYTPAANFNGSDSFDYTVCDSDNACDEATVTVLVNTVNDPPSANDDSVTTDEDTPVTFNVLSNDNDPDGNLDAGSVSVASSPANGSLSDNGSGSFTYSPAANFYGSDSFSYQVCDSDEACDTAQVSITVNSVNDAPVCGDVTPSVSTIWPPNHQWVPVTVSGVTDIEGDPISISISSIAQDEPTNGQGDGDTSPDGQGLGSDTAQVRAERAGKGNGRYYHIGFSASDGNGGTCTGTVQVSVPKSQGKNGAAVDGGPLYNSTQP
ncbi:MAG: hypothetical protein FOGNACKC_01756 [Anaerolineae bacterium]|nr:hypothetical protein [Anaerolineae bacterium]